jgi:hypothetical protein
MRQECQEADGGLERLANASTHVTITATTAGKQQQHADPVECDGTAADGAAAFAFAVKAEKERHDAVADETAGITADCTALDQEAATIGADAAADDAGAACLHRLLRPEAGEKEVSGRCGSGRALSWRFCVGFWLQ